MGSFGQTVFLSVSFWSGRCGVEWWMSATRQVQMGRAKAKKGKQVNGRAERGGEGKAKVMYCSVVYCTVVEGGRGFRHGGFRPSCYL